LQVNLSGADIREISRFAINRHTGTAQGCRKVPIPVRDTAGQIGPVNRHPFARLNNRRRAGNGYDATRSYGGQQRRFADFQELLARQVEQILRRHGHDSAAGLDHLCRRIDIGLCIQDVRRIDLQVIEGRGALGSAEDRGGRRSVEIDFQDVVCRLFGGDQVLRGDLAEYFVACQIRWRDAWGEASLRDALDGNAPLHGARGGNAAPGGRVGGVGRKLARASFQQGEIHKGRVELRPTEDLGRRRRELRRTLRHQFYAVDAQIKEAQARSGGFHPVLLSCLGIGPADSGFLEIRQNRGLGGAIHIRIGAVRAEAAGDREAGGAQVGKAAARRGDQCHAAEYLPVHVDGRVPLIDEPLIRPLVRRHAGVVKRQQLKPHGVRQDASKLVLGGRVCVIMRAPSRDSSCMAT